MRTDRMPGAARASRRQLPTRLVRAASDARGDVALAVLDAVLVTVATGCVLSLRFNGTVPQDYWSAFRGFAPVVVAVSLASNWLWGLYRQIWRHASVLEARRVALAGITSMVALVVLVLLTSRPIPLSVAVLGTATSTMLIGAVRFQSRLFAFHRRGTEPAGLRVVVMSAGDTGAAIVRDMMRTAKAGLWPVAMLDDDPAIHGRACLGVRVEGPLEALVEVARARRAHQAVLAIPSAPRDLVRRCAELAERAGVSLRLVPDVGSVLRLGVHVRDLRDLQIEDLLGREQVPIDLEAVRALIRGRRVLVTGAGGSIGSEIARQVADCEPAALLLLDHDETHVHDVAATIPRPTTQLLADIRQRALILRIFAEHRPDIVFHAAAHKHVPLLEHHPSEAVKTNILGTHNVVSAAAAAGVERLVFVSTDKAVRPQSVMGASKRLGEQIVLRAQPPGGRYCAVRFGNVLGSRGSVIPTFMRQIESGGPVTITDPRMTRFFMSIPEAVQLVLQSAALADGGEIFMLEMGEPVRILELAQRMIHLSGRRVGTDIEIHVTGVRPGEKLTEELHTPDEEPSPTPHPSIVRLLPQVPCAEAVRDMLRHLSSVVDSGRDELVRHLLFGAATASDRPDAAVPAQRREPAPAPLVDLAE